jgi:hypothetical protein
MEEVSATNNNEDEAGGRGQQKEPLGRCDPEKGRGEGCALEAKA